MNATNKQLWDEATEEDNKVRNGIEIFIAVGLSALLYYVVITIPGQLGIY